MVDKDRNGKTIWKYNNECQNNKGSSGKHLLRCTIDGVMIENVGEIANACNAQLVGIAEALNLDEFSFERANIQKPDRSMLLFPCDL